MTTAPVPGAFAPASFPSSDTPRPLAILSALPEEQQGLEQRLTDPQPAATHAGRRFVRGRLHGRPVVLALCGIGKVAAATTATVLAERFGVRGIVFTGVAGGLGEDVQVGDIVVAEACVQHDMDASPLFPRFEVPLYGRALFETDPALTGHLAQAAHATLQDLPALVPAADLGRFDLQAPQVHCGLLASGDRFVASRQEAALLRAAVPDALAVDMESAAVAQVCADYRIAFAAVRTVSDRADETAHVDFPAFVTAVASRYAEAVVGRFLGLLQKE